MRYNILIDTSTGKIESPVGREESGASRERTHRFPVSVESV